MSTATPITFIVIAPDGGLSTSTEPPTLSALQQAVGGYVEAIDLSDGRLIAWLNEDGMELDLPINHRAGNVLSILGATMATPVVLGSVAITGATETHSAAPLTPAQLATVTDSLG